MKKTSLATGLITMAAFLLPLGAVADHHEEAAAPPPLTEVWIVVPKAGMEAEFTAAATANLKYRAEQGDSRSWQAYRVALGENIRIVQFRACCFDWADQDAYEAEIAEKGLTQHWNETVHQYVDHYHHYLERMDAANSHWPDGEGDGPYFGATTWKVKQGAGPASDEARKKMSQFGIESGWDGNWLWLSRIGGTPETSIVSSFASFADMAPPEQTFYAKMVEAMGEEETAQLFADFASGFSESSYTIWKHDTAMSMPDNE